jgi:hypothetical protein
MKRLRKAYKRALKREILASSRTYEQLVEQGRLPSGGLQELFGHTKQKLAWILSLEAKDFKNKQVYNDFTDWLYSVFWVSIGLLQVSIGFLYVSTCSPYVSVGALQVFFMFLYTFSLGFYRF